MIQIYAQLSSDLSEVLLASVAIDSALITSWQSAGNPKAALYRIINMVAQPAFDPNTQAVIQNGWTITTDDVEPIWQIITLTAEQQQVVSNATQWNNTVALNLVAACTNAINNWSALSAAQKDTVLLYLVKFVRAELQYQYAINN